MPDRAKIGLVDMLALEQVDTDVFRGRSRFPPSQRIFGGEVVAQSLAAAGRTVPPDRLVHSLHGYFLRPGSAALPVDYRVEPIRDGGSFTTRRVTAQQQGRATFTLFASFGVTASGFAHQVAQVAPPPPDDLPGPEQAIVGTDGSVRQWFDTTTTRHPFELRFDGELPQVATARGEQVAPRQRFWLRSREPLPDEQWVQSCAAAYASDMLLLTSAVAPHRTMLGDPDLLFASLDHSIWFHGRFRVDDWLYYDQHGTWADGGRALVEGRMFDRTGRLVVSVVQEALLRLRPSAVPEQDGR